MDGVPPQNPDAEIMVLGALMMPDEAPAAVAAALAAGLTADDFYMAAHGEIFSAIMALHARGEPTNDYVLIVEELRRSGDEEKVAESVGMQSTRYLNWLVNSVPTAANTEYYAKLVIEPAARWRVIQDGIKILRDADRDEIPLQSVLDRLHTVIETYKPKEEKAADHQETQERYAFPIVSQKFFLEYMELFKGVTESPSSYHFFGFAAAIGMMLGRNLYVMYPHQLYPNMFALLIGRSGLERKTTAMKYADKLTRSVASVQILPMLSTYEGLLEAMSKSENGEDTNITPSQTLVIMSELNSLLMKARSENISNIIPGLCDIYDCPEELRSPTKVNPVTVKRPFLSILAGIQPAILGEAFRSRDIHGGFAGRWMYIFDTSSSSIPWPGRFDTEHFNSLVKKLSAVRDYWHTRAATELELTDEAKRSWEAFYFWWKAENEDDELLSSLCVRIPDHVLKLAMIFCALDRSDEIAQEHLDDAMRIGKWLMKNVQLLFGDFGESEMGKLESRIMDIIKTGVFTRREVRQKVGGRIDSGLFNKAVSNLVGMGMLEENKKGRRKELTKCW